MLVTKCFALWSRKQSEFQFHIKMHTLYWKSLLMRIVIFDTPIQTIIYFSNHVWTFYWYFDFDFKCRIINVLQSYKKIKPVLIESSITLFLNCLFKHFSAKITQCYFNKLYAYLLQKTAYAKWNMRRCFHVLMFPCPQEINSMVFTVPRLFVIILASQ